MMRFICFLFGFFILMNSIQSQYFLRSYASASAINLGRSDAIENLGASSLSSPALGLDEYRWQAATSFRQFGFGDLALRNYQLGFKSTVFKNQFAGLQLQYSGNESVGLLKLSTSYGRVLFDKLNIGVQFNYGQLNIEQYENLNNASIDLAIVSQPLNKLHIGIWLQNILQLRGEGLEQASLLFSSKYHLSDAVRIYASLRKTVVLPLEVGTGLYYRITELLDVKVGYFPTFSAFTFGFGLNLGDEWGLHSAAMVHPNLGMQPASSIFFQKK